MSWHECNMAAQSAVLSKTCKTMSVSRIISLCLIAPIIIILIHGPPPVNGLEMIEGIYCGTENCYEVLGVARDSPRNDIVKAYRKLARQNHPDRFHDDDEKAEAEIKFRKIAAAYETLKDEESRRDYDYMLDNPEEYYYHYMQYYRRRMTPKVDVRVVIVVTVTIISVIQYLGAMNNYRTAMSYLLTVPKYRMQAAAIAKSEGLLDEKRKKDKSKTKEELKEEEEKILRSIIENKMDIRGGYSKPSLYNVLWVQLVFSPYYLGCYIVWYARWVWRYNIQRQEYNEEDRKYLIRRYMKLKQSQWDALEDSDKDDYMERELWIKENFDEWKREKEEEMKIELANNAKYKAYRRYMKKGGPGQMSFIE